MKSIAEETGTGTMELLVTKPISSFQILLSKYLAAITLLVISILPTTIYYISMYYLGDPVGIIDAGYRGFIMAKVLHVLKRTEKKSVLEMIAEDKDYVLKRGTRLFQIVSPDLSPITVKVVDSLSETSRGEGGFGSTGTSI